jgi:hypothetical protein
MIWTSWRQQRLETIVTAALLAALAAFLVPVGVHMAGVFDDGNLAACAGRSTQAACNLELDAFRERFAPLIGAFDWFQFLPAVIGALLAVPLILDFERGTFRLGWTQSVPRGRWIAVRLATIAASALAAALLLTVLLTWSRHPFDRLDGRMAPNTFSAEGIVPYAYTLFAAALALALGVAMRRAAPALGLTIIGFFAMRILVVKLVRPHLLAPVTKVWPIGQRGPRLKGAWILEQRPVSHTGATLSPGTVFGMCPPRAEGPVSGPKGIPLDCLTAHGIQLHAVFQPASRFWALQGIEAAIFVALAALLAGGSAWWIARRLS